MISDVALPGMDGLEATRVLTEDSRTRTIPVVAVSAHGQDIDAVRANAGKRALDQRPDAAADERLDLFLVQTPKLQLIERAIERDRDFARGIDQRAVEVDDDRADAGRVM